MVEVSGEDNPLVAQCGIFAAQLSADIASRGAGLLAGYLLNVFSAEEWFQLQSAELLDQVIRGLLAPCSASAFVIRRSEDLDHSAEATLVGRGNVLCLGVRRRAGGRAKDRAD